MKVDRLGKSDMTCKIKMGLENVGRLGHCPLALRM